LSKSARTTPAPDFPNLPRADDLVASIKQAFDSLLQAERKLLSDKIEIGAQLKLAQDDIGLDNWKKWFTSKEFPFTIRTAQRWMRYAEHKEELMEAARTTRVSFFKLSLRKADELLRKPRAPKPSQIPASPKPEAGLEAPKPTSTSSSDTYATLGGMAPDEVETILSEQWEQDLREQLLVRLLKSLPASRGPRLLIDACDNDQLQSFATQITKHLQSHTNGEQHTGLKQRKGGTR
jgi:hypothetical protein